MEDYILKWVEWTQRLQAIAQNGLTYTDSPYDIERYEQLQKIVAEIIAAYTDEDFEKIKNYLSAESGYATPKIDVRGVIFKDNKILMVKEKVDNLWTLPGGWADVLYTPAENIEREVLEESGFIVKAKRLMAVYDRSKHGHSPVHPHSIYKMFFLCEIIGGEPKPNIETLAVDFFNLDNLPDLSLGRVTKKQIQKLYTLKDNPLTEFD